MKEANIAMEGDILTLEKLLKDAKDSLTKTKNQLRQDQVILIDNMMIMVVVVVVVERKTRTTPSLHIIKG